MPYNAFLSKFGLTDNEQKIYLLLLEHGAVIASVIAKRVGVKRVTAYAALESLKKKELVTSFQRNGIAYFEAASPEYILHICNLKIASDLELKEAAESFMPELKKLEEKRSKPVLEVQGKIKYYQGIDSVTSLINETLEEGSEEQLCFGLNKFHTTHRETEWRNYAKKRVKAGMRVRSIQPDKKAAKDYKKRDKEELRTTRLVPHKKFPAHCELNIIGDMIALFTAHGDQPMGAKIYNKDMAEVLRSLFELAWERAKQYDKS